MTRQRQLQTTAQRHAVYRGSDRFAARFQGAHLARQTAAVSQAAGQCRFSGSGAPGIEVTRELAEIGTHAKVASLGRSQHRATDVVAGFQRLDELIDLLLHLIRQHVHAPTLPVEANQGDAIVINNQGKMIHGVLLTPVR
ncbi:hypothetical protein D9M68_822920 [compost metagenome]